MKIPEFIDVKNVHVTNHGAQWCTDMKETITIRSHTGTVVDVVSLTSDGNLFGFYGKIRYQDLGEYVLRLMGRMPTEKPSEIAKPA